MSEWIHKRTPIAPLGLAQRREAKRACEAQHLDASERQVLDALLASRALPLVLDILDDERSRWPLIRVEFDGIDVRVRRQPSPQDLCALCLHDVESEVVQVRFIEEAAAPADSDITEDACFAVVRFYLREAAEDLLPGGVVIRRFSFNGPGSQTKPGRV